MTRRCRDCGNAFGGEHWKTRCKACYIEMKRAQERSDDLLRAYREGYVDGHRDGTPANREDGDFEPGFLRELVVLCHPDRHPPQRFEQANAVTARLLGLLNGLGESRRAA